MLPKIELTALVTRLSLLAAVIACAPRPGSQVAVAAPPSQWDADIARFEQEDRERPPQPGGVVFVGSSSIRLWNSLAADFPDFSRQSRLGGDTC